MSWNWLQLITLLFGTIVKRILFFRNADGSETVVHRRTIGDQEKRLIKQFVTLILCEI